MTEKEYQANMSEIVSFRIPDNRKLKFAPSEKNADSTLEDWFKFMDYRIKNVILCECVGEFYFNLITNNCKLQNRHCNSIGHQEYNQFRIIDSTSNTSNDIIIM